MPSKGLHLKRTPAEQAERDLHKARKAARKIARKRHNDDQADSSSGELEREHAHSERRAKRKRNTHDSANYSYVFDDEDRKPMQNFVPCPFRDLHI